MTYPEKSTVNEDPPRPDVDDVLSHLTISSADRILIYLAVSAMKLGGHRYGAFIEAATAAAKLAVYTSYLDHGNNVRKTGLIHHVEPKSVRTIVKEVKDALDEGRSLTTLSDQAPYYLSGLPYLWQEKYPWQPGHPRLRRSELTPGEQRQLEAKLPDAYPPACVLDEFQFLDLIELLHTKSQEDFPPKQRMKFSAALKDHIRFRLLHSGTVTQMTTPSLSIKLFALARTHYAPRGERERAFTMVDDVARFFRLMQDWTLEQDGVMRALEVFDVDSDRRVEALQELDQLLQSWADKYHKDGGYPMLLQLAAGTRQPQDGQ